MGGASKGKGGDTSSRPACAGRQQGTEPQADKRDFAYARFAPEEVDGGADICNPGCDAIGIFAAAGGICGSMIVETQDRHAGARNRFGKIMHRSPAAEFFVTEGTTQDDSAAAGAGCSQPRQSSKATGTNEPPLPRGFDPRGWGRGIEMR